MRRLVWLTVAVLALAGACANDGSNRRQSFPAAPEPGAAPIIMDPVTGEAAFALRVMTWNVAGLPAPLKMGRAGALRAIGNALAALRARGEAPHVLLIQEGFMDAPMADLIARSGYAHVAQGPDAGDDAPRGDPRMEDASALRGEGLGKLFGAGLYILSDFPIVDTQRVVYAACAGFDCLASKGAMLARIAAPGAPEPIAVLNTHLNAKRASHAPMARAHAAHHRQIDTLERFVADTLRPGETLVFGGDFNMRNAPERWDYAAPAGPLSLARAWCAQSDGLCDASALTEAELTDRDAQDLLGFHDGAAMRARPQRLAIVNDEYAPDALSDHSAYLVEYRISWSAAAPRRAGAGLYAGLFGGGAETDATLLAELAPAP